MSEGMAPAQEKACIVWRMCIVAGFAAIKRAHLGKAAQNRTAPCDFADDFATFRCERKVVQRMDRLKRRIVEGDRQFHFQAAALHSERLGDPERDAVARP